MSKLHRWALLDKKGRNRGTCEAKNYADAKGNFLSKRRSPIPKGWRIVDRGPVEDDTLALAADPTPEPRAFKVGDEVRHKSCNPEEVGVIKRLLLASAFVVWPSAPDRPDGVMSPLKNLRHAEPVPQPKAEARRVDVDLLIAERDGLLVLKAEHEGEIATLKAEVERLNHSLSDARSECVENYHQFSAAKARAEAAEAKLDDIAAIMRTFKIFDALGSEASFTDAVAHVLGGAA